MRTDSRLFGAALQAAARPWLDELGKSDRDRLVKIVGAATAERTRLVEVLAAAFPEVREEKKAVADLTKFRKRVNDVAAGTTGTGGDLGLRLEVDSKKKNPAGERWCWFTGPDPMEEMASRFSEQATADIEGKPFVKSKGIATTGSAMAAGKKVVRFFVSYAHANQGLADALVEGLKRQFGASARYELELWMDPRILVGARWRESILEAIEGSGFGLFLVSPEFLGSDFIGEHEIPPFVGPGAVKPVIPVGLAPVSFDRQDLKGLEKHQLYRLRGRSFMQMRGSAEKAAFIHDLYLRIEKRLEDHFGAGDKGSGSRDQARKGALGESFVGPLTAEAAERLINLPEETKHFQRTKGQAFMLAERERLDDTASTRAGDARDALQELEAWACRPDGSPFFALLGEVGIGKTTTLKQLTRGLIERRRMGAMEEKGRLGGLSHPQKGGQPPSPEGLRSPRECPPHFPLPIYIDLRDFVGETAGAVPTLEQLLTSVIERSWRVTERKVTAGDLVRLVREEGALIIFDGLDEKIVHLTPDRARDFIRALWSVLPDAMLMKKQKQEGKVPGKVIISCRSHYFRDVWSQNAMLCGEDREGLDKSRYPAFCLLPFSEEQIRSYLASFLGDAERGRQAFELIASIHNLRDLAERPYLLSLISSRLGELEALQARGETVNAARLYDLVVRSWLNRDDGKHQIEAAHKRRLMEDLAAALWRSGEKMWEADRLEEWLDDYLSARPALSQAYATKDRALLKEDLRTATFVLRPDSEEKNFRFAHTSLQEYFLAAFLVRALRDGKPEEWDLPMVSAETLDFVGQILALEKRAEMLKTMEAVLGGGCLRAAMLAFRYWLRAVEKGYPEPEPKHVNLAGAEMEEWVIRGAGKGRLLDLRGAALRGAQLSRARLENVDLTGADLTGMEARQGLWMGVLAAGAKLDGADLAGVQWRGGRLVKASLEGAEMAGVEATEVDLGGAPSPDLAEMAGPAHPPPHDPLWMKRGGGFTGHSSYVSACAWSADGRRLLSGSWDNTLKVWDAATGRELLTLKGHSSYVSACAWSADGRRLLSGSDDNTLKVWDAATGRELLTLKGHSSSVRACAWSADGRRLLSGSDDTTLKVWDAASGRELLTLKGHSSYVRACAWSADGRRLLSGSWDTTLKVWDAATGRELLTLKGHSSYVSACAWSADGRRLLSGSDDTTLKVWDAASGRELLTLKGHSSYVRACAWSADGRRLLSGSDDTTLKVWDAASGRELLTLKGHSSYVTACAWSADGRRLLSGSWDTTLKVWDAASGRELLTLKGHSSYVSACAWSADGRRLLSGSWDTTLKVWDAASGRELLTLKGHSRSVRACAWSADGRRLLSGSWDNTLKVWDAATGRELLTLKGHSSYVSACAWSADGRRLLSGSDDKTLKVWDAATGRELLTLKGHSSSVRACAWSADGRRLLSGSDDNTLKVWDAATGRELLTLKGHSSYVRACAWSADGRRLLSGSWDTTLKVWDAATGRELLTLKGHSSYVSACAWSADGRRLLSGSDDNTLKVWDAATGRELLTLKGHSSSVRACAWSADGRRLLSGSDDTTLKVWDAASGACLWTGHCLPQEQSASISGDKQKILWASPEAWRWLGWTIRDEEGRFVKRLPAEAFGPLPG